ncbi:Uncharacterized protein APZ42_013484, partial [Daphnia magna]
ADGAGYKGFICDLVSCGPLTEKEVLKILPGAIGRKPYIAT